MSAGGSLSFGSNFEPKGVTHRDGHTWLVKQVLCTWKHPGSAPEQFRLPDVTWCWRMLISGPLPGDPGRSGDFVMRATGRGNRPGWELSPGQEHCECPARIRRPGLAQSPVNVLGAPRIR
ncbi:MAG TPA: hypothetical protein VMV92_43670 [Streptosporangiaceae bacterium]|nr:hypothetical protein [Streptosporangiaceae bacterium]